MSLEGASVIHASRHYERAGLRPQAFRASMTAADEASRISARQEAYELYQRAIANMPADLPVGEQAELYERFADAAGAIERNEDCATAATRARELYLEAGRPLEAAGMLISLSRIATRDGSPSHELGAYVDQGLEETAAPAGHAGTREAPGVPPERAVPTTGSWPRTSRPRGSEAVAARELADVGRRSGDRPGGRPAPGPDRHRRRPLRDRSQRRHAGSSRGP